MNKQTLRRKRFQQVKPRVSYPLGLVHTLELRGTKCFWTSLPTTVEHFVFTAPVCDLSAKGILVQSLKTERFW